MNLFACQTCHRTYQVGGNLEEIQALLTEENYPCITPLCAGRLSRVMGIASTCFEVPFPSFYRAINGFGLSTGHAASLARFVALLKTKKIVSIDAEPTGQPERVILRKLVLDDGTRLHFETSSKGACCYFIEEAGPTCLEVLEREQSGVVDHQAVAQGNASNREEVGRAPGGHQGADGEEQRVQPVSSAVLGRKDSVSDLSKTSGVPTRPDTGPERGGEDSH